ncbi:alpha/beta fold hydrolase [Sphingomonas sp. PB2P19]|uniref:alpha/beta fold hydrolase n=1 Tax=Sphingomonas rhamnosi TaxID=3096156 RepID=UPI002FC5D1EE
MTPPAQKWIGGAMLATVSGLGLAFYANRVARAAEALVPAEGQFLGVTGGRLHYVDRGNGPAIVMIHGLAGQLSNFSYMLPDHLIDSHRVIVVDRPGSGYSTADVGTTPGLIAQAAMIAELIVALKLDRPLLVGHSLGGAVSLSLALDHPELVRGLALIAPLTQIQRNVPDSFRGLAMVPQSARMVFAQTIGTPLSKLTARQSLAAVFAPEVPPEDFGIRGGGVLSQRPSAIAAASADLFGANADLKQMVPRYAQLRVPTSILFGRQDAILDPGLHGHRTAAIVPGAKMETIEGGHMLPVTLPDATARFVRAAFAYGHTERDLEKTRRNTI